MRCAAPAAVTQTDPMRLNAAKNITQDTLERYLAKAGARIEPSTDASRDLAGLAGTITEALLSAGTVFPAGIVNPHEAAESAVRAAENPGVQCAPGRPRRGQQHAAARRDAVPLSRPRGHCAPSR